MNIKIFDNDFYGTVEIPPSKSVAHRMFICAFLSRKNVCLKNISELNDDLKNTLNCLYQLGANYIIKKNVVEFLTPSEPRSNVLNCGESGSTLRFLIPISMCYFEETTFMCGDKLLERPLDVYFKLFDSQKIPYTIECNRLTIKGKLKIENIKINELVSSQFITGLLYYMSLQNNDCTLKVNCPIESKPYIDLTIKIFERFGLLIECKEKTFKFIKKTYDKISSFTLEGDFSSAAFLIALGIFSKKGIILKNLNKDSFQADKKILEFLDLIKCYYKWDKDDLLVSSSSLRFSNCKFSLKDCPDLGPILFVIASFIQGRTTFDDIRRLRFKESDRVSTMEKELKKVGVDIKVSENQVIINGKSKYDNSYDFLTYNDHRVAMALTVFSIINKSKNTIRNIECINKSYPSFLDDLKKINIDVEEVI